MEPIDVGNIKSERMTPSMEVLTIDEDVEGNSKIAYIPRLVDSPNPTSSLYFSYKIRMIMKSN